MGNSTDIMMSTKKIKSMEGFHNSTRTRWSGTNGNWRRRSKYNFLI